LIVTGSFSVVDVVNFVLTLVLLTLIVLFLCSISILSLFCHYCPLFACHFLRNKIGRNGKDRGRILVNRVLKLTFDYFRNWFLHWDLLRLLFVGFFNMFDYWFNQLFFNGRFFC
jgi:hypothetical protein